MISKSRIDTSFSGQGTHNVGLLFQAIDSEI